MSLRASSTTLRRRIDELENTFKVWRIRGVVDSTRLRRVSDEIRTIQGNTFNREYILQTYNLNTLETEFLKKCSKSNEQMSLFKRQALILNRVWT